MASKATVARRLYEAWNKRDFDVVTDSVTPDAQLTVAATGDSYTGPDGLRQYSTMWADAFPDGEITLDRLIPSGDNLIVEFTEHGTHTGTWSAPTGSIPATGHSVTLHVCDVLEFSDGKLCQQRTYFDGDSLMMQLGVSDGAGVAAAPIIDRWGIGYG
jgi:steroid delta-isomerase-like uncharacterized protein